MAQPPNVALAVLYYTVCSSTMLVANKVTMNAIPLPATVSALQLAGAIVFIKGASALRMMQVDSIAWPQVRSFLPYMVGFVVSVYASGRSLENSNVETVIVFRACSPLLVSILDWAFLGRNLPSLRSLCSLLGVVASAIGYVNTDADFKLNGLRAYTWVVIYLLAISFEMTYGKKLISGIKFETPVWGSVLYTNLLGLPPMLVLVVASGELDTAQSVAETADTFGCVAFLISVILGIGIGWSGWNCRNEISATAYTLVGVCCKFISVLLNIVIWDKHASPAGICWLVVCLLAGTMYQQAPMRASAVSKAAEDPYLKLGAAKLGNDTADCAACVVDEQELEDGSGRTPSHRLAREPKE
eukprot:gb/GFBE01072903.1/.p1 GENE.gb/GFBE01072903.1/~~gb/GFBE01072903.1/.p1  ORF type:complete len:357 (+),score=69.59 gb/GFBE01072903.1/:1-1071(+)